MAVAMIDVIASARSRADINPEEVSATFSWVIILVAQTLSVCLLSERLLLHLAA